MPKVCGKQLLFMFQVDSSYCTFFFSTSVYFLCAEDDEVKPMLNFLSNTRLASSASKQSLVLLQTEASTFDSATIAQELLGNASSHSRMRALLRSLFLLRFNLQADGTWLEVYMHEHVVGQKHNIPELFAKALLCYIRFQSCDLPQQALFHAVTLLIKSAIPSLRQLTGNETLTALRSSPKSPSASFSLWDFDPTEIKFQLALAMNQSQGEMLWTPRAVIDWPDGQDGGAGSAPVADTCFFEDCPEKDAQKSSKIINTCF